MNKRRALFKKALAVACSAVLLFSCGCGKGQSGNVQTQSGSTIKTKLKIYCNSYYNYALERISRSFSSSYPEIKIAFTESRNDADILITDRMTSSEAEALVPLDGVAKSADFIEELLFRRGDEIIGLPLFLETDGIWLDRLPYLRENTDIPYRFGDAIGSEFIKTMPILAANDLNSIYWGFISPIYISYGGSSDNISTGGLSGEALEKSIERLREMAADGAIKLSDKPASFFTAGQAAGWLCSFLDIVKIQQDMPLSSKLAFSPGITAYDNEGIRLIIRADTLFVAEKADKSAADLFITELFGEDSILKLISDTHLPPAVKVNCKNHSLPEIFREFYSVLSSTSVKTVYVTDSRTDSAIEQLNRDIAAAFKAQ